MLLVPAVAGAAWAQKAPSNAWPVTTPGKAGVSAAVLDSISGEISTGQYGHIDRFLVIRRGQIVSDKRFTWNYDSIYGERAKVGDPLNAGDLSGPYNYYNPWWHPTYRRGDLHTLQSVTKTVTSVIIGTAIARGDFPSIDTPVLSFFDTTKVQNIDDRKRRLKVRHLLTMTGGFDWNENLPYVDPRNDAVVMEASHDWVTYTINKPMAREPGERFNYSSGESELLAAIFFKATGLDVEEYAARYLFGPIGIERWYWKRIPTGLVDTEGGLYLEARDLARIWQLFLQGGTWKGKQVVTREWVTESVKPAVPVGNRPGSQMYGLKWWLRRDPADSSKFIWAGSGFGGQFPLALPEQEMVVVFNGWTILPGEKFLPVDRLVARLQKGVR
jgi:CubicO group peptidase (beta-lactamase class C family)